MSSLTVNFRHVTILHGEDGVPWCQHLVNYLQQPDLHLRVETLNLSNLPYENPPELVVSLKESYVILVLMTADAIDYIESESRWLSAMFKQCEEGVNSIIATPCHVDSDEVTNVCNDGRYDTLNWNFIEVEMNGSNVQQIIGLALQCVDANKERRNHKLMQSKELRRSSVEFCEIYPSSLQQADEKCAIVFKCDVAGEIIMMIRKKEIAVEMINPYCAVFRIPDLPIGKHTAVIMVDGEVKATCRLTYMPFTPSSLDLLMETFHVSKKQDMDTLLAENYYQTVCNDPCLMKMQQNLNISTDSKTRTKHPTLIHWAAENGLKELCSQMMMSPGVTSACTILNCDHHNAADLAAANGYLELSEYISDFLETQLYVEACNLYVQTQSAANDEDIYVEPSAPQIPAIPRTRSVSSPPRSQSRTPPPILPRNRKSVNSLPSEPAGVPKIDNPELKLSNAAVGCRSQNELIDIMEDFKKGEFNLGEVDMFFKSWKERYNTGKAVSFKEKQDQLEDFRAKNKTLFAAKKQKKVKGMHEQATIREEVETLSISEPIIPRKTTVGMSSNRIKDALSLSGRGSETSTGSTSSSASYDSGRGSGLSLLSTLGIEEEKNPKRKSCSQIFNDLRQQSQEEMKPPPLPPRKQKSNVYVKTKSRKGLK